MYDVEAWLEEVEPRVMAFWEAFDRVEPIGDAWQQTATIAYSVEQLINVQLLKAGGKPRQLTADDFMPPRYDRPKKKVAKQQASEIKGKLTGIFNIAGKRNAKNNNAG